MSSLSRSATPADLKITPRDRRFGRDDVQARWWLAGDPFGTAFHNALSITFPKGEAYFVESVKAFRDGAPDKLAREIRAFVQQEVMHSREHVVFNRRVAETGYDIAPLEQAVVDTLALTQGRPPILNLAVTMALEHYTAILAQQILTDPRIFAGADAEWADLWRWHAIEEIEHKCVAYDTFLHATAGWSRVRRWRLKSLAMLIVTAKFWPRRITGMHYLLAQDGITGWRSMWGIARYLLLSPGTVRRIVPAWLSYFMPGFHPWNHDDRALIGSYDSDYEAARLPMQQVAANAT